VSSFASFFKKHTGTPTDAPAAYTHDAILLLRHLAWRTSPDKGAQRPTSFANLPPLNGLTGPLAFEPSGKRILRLTVAVRQNHHWLDLP
jgi:hypothetical protein